jgi:hypothetical protein
MAFFTQKAKLCKHLTITLFFEKNANFFAEGGEMMLVMPSNCST